MVISNGVWDFAVNLLLGWRDDDSVLIFLFALLPERVVVHVRHSALEQSSMEVEDVVERGARYQVPMMPARTLMGTWRFHADL